MQQDLEVTFITNRDDEAQGKLTFSNCWRYRLGPTNDEGWWRKQCRFSLAAPEWGEFYEVTGDLKLEWLPEDAWTVTGEPGDSTRHFLFYFRDNTLECDADAWRFELLEPGG